MDVSNLLQKAKSGFGSLSVASGLQVAALKYLQVWLTDEKYAVYQPQLEYLIQAGKWDFLLDAFYQVIPFGTGGRRGLVGIGPNRINMDTIESSAQGHAEFLLKKYGGEAKKRGVVLSFDVRVFTQVEEYNDSIPNPVKNLSCVDLANAAACVYSANGIKTFIFDGPRSTPELSFAIRHLKAISGDMFSASHNAPPDNGKKVYDEHGGQLVPPFDQELVDEVTKNVSVIKRVEYDIAKNDGLIEVIGSTVDKAYVAVVLKESLSDNRNVKVLYSPLHGCGLSSLYGTLKAAGVEVTLDPMTKNPSGAFENITFNNPNPEVLASYDTMLVEAKDKQYDLLINSDPDADRVGVMVLHNNEYQFLNGNEIGIVLSSFALSKRKELGTLSKKSTIVKTLVTTSLIQKLCDAYGITCVGDLLVGFKYIGNEMNKLESEGRIDDFVMGTEESHGFLAGGYARDKDASLPALWLCELAGELKEKGETIVDYLQSLYAKHGYCYNYLNEIRLTGASGVEKIRKIMEYLRVQTPESFGSFEVISKKDYLDDKPYVSTTDESSKNVMSFILNAGDGIEQVKITVRPSGTEPKIKFYFGVVAPLANKSDFEKVDAELEEKIKSYVSDLGLD